MACLRASLTKSARTVLKYSLGLTEENQTKPHCVIQALKECYGASIGVLSGETKVPSTNSTIKPLEHGNLEYEIKRPSVSTKISKMSS